MIHFTTKISERSSGIVLKITFATSDPLPRASFRHKNGHNSDRCLPKRIFEYAITAFPHSHRYEHFFIGAQQPDQPELVPLQRTGPQEDAGSRPRR